jgi:uncharacterized protein YndB with AHSA1/START domain
MSKAASSQIMPDQDAIVGEVEVDAPPELVFRALTDPAQLIRWWSDAVCQTRTTRVAGRDCSNCFENILSKDFE